MLPREEIHLVCSPGIALTTRNLHILGQFERIGQIAKLIDDANGAAKCSAYLRPPNNPLSLQRSDPANSPPVLRVVAGSILPHPMLPDGGRM